MLLPVTDCIETEGDLVAENPAGQPTPAAEAGPPDRRGAKSDMPRWVRVFVVVSVLLAVLLLIGLLTGGHQPGRHSGAPGPMEIGVTSARSLTSQPTADTSIAWG